MNLIKASFALLFICCLHEIFCQVKFNEEVENVNRAPNNSGESEFYLKFVRGPANYTLKNIGSHVRMKCGVTLSRFINEALNSSFEFKDVQNTTDFLLRKVRIKWFRKESQIGNIKNKIAIKRADSNGTVWSILRIHNIDASDKGSYYCTANIGKNNSIKSSQGELDVEFNKPTGFGSDSDEESEISYDPLFTHIDSDQTTTFNVIDYTIPHPPDSVINNKNDLNTQTFDPFVYETFTKTTSQIPVPPAEGICQMYTGRACIEFLDGQHVFIPYPITQLALEEKLIAAFKVVNYSNEISSNCVGYAIPSLCFSTFPVCITPNETNTLFFQHFEEFGDSTNKIEKEHSHHLVDSTDDDPVLHVQFDNMPPGGLPPHLDPKYNSYSNSPLHTFKKLNDRFKRFSHEKKFVMDSSSKNEFHRGFSLSRSANALRRVCREDCEILEDELCQIEYAIAKRHPEIGQKLTLEECKDLPLEAEDCLQIGIEKHFGSDTCFWETGIYYRGNVNISMSGLPCNKWSSQFIYKMANHPELTGKHNYCRNPGGKEPQPWCYVFTKDRGQIKEFCDIPKCSQKIWLYIIAAMLGAFMLFSFCLMLICCRQRNSKNNTAAIRNINLPNADKNIYGNSRLNSPIELSDLLTHNPNSRRNGISRVPQYSLAQIKFVEELGEGAFGKVYKGELTRDSEKVFVAVKALKENASQKTQQDFKREIELISELHHENIVCILGVVLREEPLCMLFEFMAKGDLHEFLMSKVPPEGCGLSPTQFLMIAQHIASGMEYLAAHHYVHRDLAARNCLVSDNMVVKISDFGLSRDIYSSDYYRVQSKSLLPVRWMPPESILYGKFTTESDVWSYGIVLWEIYSYGLQPYYGYSNQDVINMVRNRQLLQCPNDCPRSVYALMKECWHQTPAKRPTFTYITQRLSAWLRPNSNLHCDNTSDSSGATSSQKALQSVGDPRERIPLIGNHSSSNGSLAGSMPRKLSTAGSIRSQGRLMMSSSEVMSGSDLGENSFKGKKSSCGSLLESSEKLSQRDTVVKLPNVTQPFDI